MINAKIPFKQLRWHFTSVPLLISLATSSSAKETQPVHQLKEFPKLPQMPQMPEVMIEY
jgi:hypothetical protein